MRDFTPEEKELIVNTPITREVFNMKPYVDSFYEFEADAVLWNLENIRQRYIVTRKDIYLNRLLSLLPNSYKVVNLCAERKAICKNKHTVSAAPHYYNHLTAKPCYEVYSCDKCDCFKI
ncbi:MAG: hypothetical protein K6E22_12800 [Treponema sp.]|nr:hypothetical protein [Treponema sp.]